MDAAAAEADERQGGDLIRHDYWKGRFWPRSDALEALMSDISEDCYCAGWMTGTETTLYGIVFQGSDRHWGMGRVDPDDIVELRRLAEADGVWVKWPDESSWPVVVPLAMCPEALTGSIRAGDELLR